MPTSGRNPHILDSTWGLLWRSNTTFWVQHQEWHIKILLVEGGVSAAERQCCTDCFFFSSSFSLFLGKIQKFSSICFLYTIWFLIFLLLLFLFFVDFFSISSLIIWFQLIFTSNLVLILLIAIYFFFIIFLIKFYFQFHPLIFDFDIFFNQIWSPFFLLLFVLLWILFLLPFFF